MNNEVNFIDRESYLRVQDLQMKPSRWILIQSEYVRKKEQMRIQQSLEDSKSQLNEEI